MYILEWFLSWPIPEFPLYGVVDGYHLRVSTE